MTVKRHLCVAHRGLFFSNMEACPLCEEIKRFSDQTEELVRQAAKIEALQCDIKHHSETFQGQMRTIDEQDEMIRRLKDTKPQTDYRETEATREKLRSNAEVIRELETRLAGLEIGITHHSKIIREQAETISEQTETIDRLTATLKKQNETNKVSVRSSAPRCCCGWLMNVYDDEVAEPEEDLPCKEPRRPSDERSRRGTEVSPRTWAEGEAGP